MRQKSPPLTYEHMRLRDEIKCLREQNQRLKKRLQRIQDAMHLVYVSKKKYKAKFKEVKQKLDILQTVYSKNFQRNQCIHLGQYYEGFEQNRFSSQQRNYNLLKANKAKQRSYQSNRLKQSHMKQDQTSNTLHTLQSLRKSSNKQPSDDWFFRKKKQMIDQQSSSKEKSLSKDVGKIFKFNKTKQSNIKYHSSGSECQNQVFSNNQQTKQINFQRRGTSSRVERNQAQQMNEGKSLKQMMHNLIFQLKTFSTSNNADKNLKSLQKHNVNLLSTESTNLYEKLQQVSSKLNQIEFNQQRLMHRISQHEQKLVQNTKKITSKNQNSNSRINNSFLKAIEDIGKDLSDWKIDYGCDTK